MNRRLVAAVAVVALALLAAAGGYVFFGPPQSQASAAGRYQTITPPQARELIESRADLQVVDVRSPEEFRRGALPGSVLIPFWDFMKGNYTLAKERPVLLVCAVGGRSLAVGQLLAGKGHLEVYNLKGGLDAWIEQKVPLPRPARR